MKRKAAAFGLAFSATECFAAYLPLSAVLPAVASLVTFFIVALLIPKKKRNKGNPYVILLAGILAGFGWFATWNAAAVQPTIKLASHEYTVTAVVQTDCRASYADGYVHATLQLLTLNGEATTVRTVCDAMPGAEPGDVITGRFLLSSLPPDESKLSYYARGIFLEAEYQEGFAVTGQSVSTTFTFYRLRQRLARTLCTYLTPNAAALEIAMLLGERSRITSAISLAFRAAGVSHILVVSGLHVGILCVLLSVLPLGKSIYLAVPAKIVVVVAYMQLTGGSVSVLRAGLVYILAEVGRLILQPPDTLSAMGILLVAFSLGNAYAPRDVGLQLSFAASCGVQCSAAAATWLKARPLGRGATALSALGRPGILLWGLAHKVWATLQTALLASLATFPVLLAHGMTVSGVGLLSNLLVVWVVPYALLGGFAVLGCMALPFLQPVAHLLSLLLSVLLGLLYSAVKFCAGLPLARLNLPKEYALFAYCVVAAVGLVFYMRKELPHFIPCACALATFAVICGVLATSNVVEIAMVGNRASPCAVVTQNGQAAVFFRGGTANLTAVEEYLAAHGAPQTVQLYDLRDEGREMEFDAQQVVQTQTLPQGNSVFTPLRDVEVSIYHENHGTNLAILNIRGYHVGMASGRMEIAPTIWLDGFLAGSTLPPCIKAQTVYTRQLQPRWFAKDADYAVNYCSEQAALSIRPGVSVRKTGVTQLVVQ